MLMKPLFTPPPPSLRFGAVHGGYKTTSEAEAAAHQLNLKDRFGIVKESSQSFTLLTGEDCQSALHSGRRITAIFRPLDLSTFRSKYRLPTGEGFPFDFAAYFLGGRPDGLVYNRHTLKPLYCDLIKQMIGTNHAVRYSYVVTDLGSKKPHGHVIEIQKQNNPTVLVTTTDREDNGFRQDGTEVFKKQQFSLNLQTGESEVLENMTILKDLNIRFIYDTNQLNLLDPYLEPLFYLTQMVLASGRETVFIKTKATTNSKWEQPVYRSGAQVSRALPNLTTHLENVLSHIHPRED